VSIPAAAVEGRPVGLSLVAARGADGLLVRTALAMEEA
jgi:Asp-tRNA(Asn)/Glu-tRNA(Gln) amidotransferase A subunit family amidase